MNFIKSFRSVDGKREARIIAEIVTPPPIASFRIVCLTDDEFTKQLTYHPVHSLEQITNDAKEFVK